MLKVFMFLLCFGLSLIGFSYIISYLNMLTIGCSLKDYLMFILSRIECVVGIISLIFLNIMILKK